MTAASASKLGGASRSAPPDMFNVHVLMGSPSRIRLNLRSAGAYLAKRGVVRTWSSRSSPPSLEFLTTKTGWKYKFGHLKATP